MSVSKIIRFAMFGSVLLVGILAIARPPASGYHLLKTYPFGLAEGSTTEYFDYITVDPDARRVSSVVHHDVPVPVEGVDADLGGRVPFAPEVETRRVVDGDHSQADRRLSLICQPHLAGIPYRVSVVQSDRLEDADRIAALAVRIRDPRRRDPD